MQLLFILFGGFGISLLATKYFTKEFNHSLSGRIAMSVFLFTTAIGHFVFVPGMMMMIPEIIPFKKELVYLTGIIEICAGIGLLISRVQFLTSWLLIIFLLLILPANINAALNQVDFQTGTNTGSGKEYLWFRIPMQLFLIAWSIFLVYI